MEISRTTTVILALACATVGAGGTFLALRGNIAPVGATERVEGPGTPVAVAESEALLDDVPTAPSTVEPAPPPRPSPARPAASRAETRHEAPAPPEVDPPSPPDAPEALPVAPVEPQAIAENQPPQPVEPTGPVYEELVVAADSVIGLQLESPVTSERAEVEDNVVARVARDVRVGDRVAIPSGARVFGEVTFVERGGRLRERARLGVRFTSIALADGTRLPISTETVYREGDAPGRESAAKIGGGAIGGAIIGGILGGAKGAAIGGSIGAGAGTTAVMAGARNHATLAGGSPLTVRLEEPVVVTVER
jgi:hypothetical protein